MPPFSVFKLARANWQVQASSLDGERSRSNCSLNLGSSRHTDGSIARRPKRSSISCAKTLEKMQVSVRVATADERRFLAFADVHVGAEPVRCRGVSGHP